MAMRNGWIITKLMVFVGAIVIGAALLIGGLYLVKDRGESARREQAVEVATAELEKRSSEEVKSEQTPAPEKEAESTHDDTSKGEQSVGELPQTGPTEASLFVIAVLAFAGATYARSRRQLSRL